jgi:hypothetical protein
VRTPSGGRQAGGRAHSPEGEGTAGEQLRSVPRTPSQAEPVWAAELEALAAVVEVDAWGAALAGARVVWVRMAVVMAEVAGAVAKVVRAGVVVRRAMAGVVRALAGGGGVVARAGVVRAMAGVVRAMAGVVVKAMAEVRARAGGLVAEVAKVAEVAVMAVMAGATGAVAKVAARTKHRW